MPLKTVDQDTLWDALALASLEAQALADDRPVGRTSQGTSLGVP